MESKRLGRTLPAVINGLSAAQAQSQGFIEVPSDADTASVANSESLFVGESDDESNSARSRSESPQKIPDVNGRAPQLNPAATPFDPKPTTSTAPAHPNPFAATTTFGKPSGTQIQSNSTPVFSFSSKSTNQAAQNPFESKIPPKSSFFPSQPAPTTEGHSNGFSLSPFAPPMEKKPIFGQPSTTFPATTNPETIKAIAQKTATPIEAAVPSKPNSVFDQPAALSAPPVFSFETSPLFGSAPTEPKAHDSKANQSQISGEKPPSVSAPQQKDAAIKPPTSTTALTSKSTPFSLFPPSDRLTKETNHPPAAPSNFPTSKETLLPTPEPQLNSKSPQPSAIFPSSTTPTFQPPLSSPISKSSEAVQKPTSFLEPTASNSQALSGPTLFQPSGSQFGKEQATSAPSQLDPKSVALDKLSRLMLLEDNGVIQHFIEFTVGPIIKSSIAQYNDELSWKEASQFSPSRTRCGERMLIGSRGMSCDFVSQKILHEVEG